MDFEPSELVRVVAIGESSVGKTAIISRLVNGYFPPNDRPTIGSMFILHKVQIEDEFIEIQLWDTAGQERFRSLGPVYYRSASAALVIFDLSQPNTFFKLSNWISSFIDIAGNDTIIAIVANKFDLIESSTLSIEETQEWAKSKGYLFFVTSAKEGIGINELFLTISKELIKKKKNLNKKNLNLKIEKNKNNCC